MNTREIINRLTEARKASGLSQTEAAKLLGYTNASSLSAIESDYRDTEPNLSMFLKMCEIYDVSPVWALTGKNPDFSGEDFDKLAQFLTAAVEDLANLKEILERLNSKGSQ